MKKLLSVALLSAIVLLVATSSVFSLDDQSLRIGHTVRTTAERSDEHSHEMDSVEQDMGIVPMGYYSYYTYQIRSLSSVRLKRKIFVRYLTGSWAQADGYTWSRANSASLSFSGSLSSGEKSAVKAQWSLAGSYYTTTYSVQVHLPANPSKFSKLAYGSDFRYRDFKIKPTFHHGVGPSCSSHDHIYYGWEYSTYKEPTDDTYLYVVYQ